MPERRRRGGPEPASSQNERQTDQRAAVVFGQQPLQGLGELLRELAVERTARRAGEAGVDLLHPTVTMDGEVVGHEFKLVVVTFCCISIEHMLLLWL
jgi:hypothetical protein